MARQFTSAHYTRDSFRFARLHILVASALYALAHVAPTCAQQMITPDKVISEPYLQMGNDKIKVCGIHWANFVVKGDRVYAYDVRIAGVGLVETHKGTSLAWGALRNIALANPRDHIDTAPIDMFLLVQGDPEAYRLVPKPDILPLNSYGGYVDADGDSKGAAALALAVLNKTPILVNLVFSRPDLRFGNETVVINVVNTLPDDQDSALVDCFQRMLARPPPK